jgi:FkbM family methyltransferase
MENIFKELFNKYNIIPKNIIHGGAHLAEEKNLYTEAGANKIIWIEANPELVERLSIDPRLSSDIIVNIGLSDKEQIVDLKIANNSYSSSILDMKIHLEIMPDIVQDKSVRIKTKTLNHIIKELGVNMQEYNILVLDIQGYELYALRGAEEILPHLDCIFTEVNFIEMYKDCVIIEELDEFLAKFGFKREYTADTFSWGYADALYVRK